ncbi:MAG: FAD-dependent oxidoreductase [Candidatus Cloacimonetes bacterium]|nr:FAD-dependent oxidoreductase [Candidatus Cloacimonadota bacterium]
MALHLLIIGANAAGLAAAMEARRRDAHCRITVLEASTDISWSSCDLPYSMTSGRSPEDLVLRRPEDFRLQGIEILLEHRVTELDPLRAQLRGVRAFGQAFEIGWDRLILCSGARVRPLPDLRGRPANLPGVRSLADGRRLAEALPSARRIIVIGGGPIGLEVLECLQAPGRELMLLERDPRLLADWPDFVGRALGDRLDSREIRVRCGQTVSAVEYAGGVARVHTAAGAPLEADLLVNCAGILPNTDYLPDGFLQTDSRGLLVVDAQMRTSQPGIFAAGDIVLRRSCVDGRLFWNSQALDARRGGRIAGANAIAADSATPLELPPGPGTLALSVFGLELARCGLHCPPGKEPAGTPGAPLEGFWQDEDGGAARSLLPAPRSVAPQGPGLLGQRQPGNWESLPVHSAAPGARVALVRHRSPVSGHRKESRSLELQLEAEASGGRLRGAVLLADGSGALRINTVAALLQLGADWSQLEALDLAYTPPLGPAVDPLIQAARRLGRLIRHTGERDND